MNPTIIINNNQLIHIESHAWPLTSDDVGSSESEAVLYLYVSVGWFEIHLISIQISCNI